MKIGTQVRFRPACDGKVQYKKKSNMKTHVLLVDKDKKDLRFFMDALNQCFDSFKCTCANTNDQAIEILRYLEPDFIFVVNDPPRKQGLELLSAIRFEPRLRSAKVFICSNQLNDETKKMAEILGAAGCIEKQGAISFAQQLQVAVLKQEVLKHSGNEKTHITDR